MEPIISKVRSLKDVIKQINIISDENETYKLVFFNLNFNSLRFYAY